MATTNQVTTFAEAGIALHAKLMSAMQPSTSAAAGGSNSNPSNNPALITPSPLLTRVLRRTATDFADIIVDGRCATGSRQVGSAAAVWVHHNTAVRNAGANVSANSSPSTTAATTAAGGAGNTNSGTSSSFPTSITGGFSSNGGITPLYYTEAALNECRHLLALYSFHCLLTASQLYNNSQGNATAQVCPAVDGRVYQLPAAAAQWAPEVSFIIAETEASAEELLKLCRSLAEACNSDVQVSTAIGSKTPASIILRPPSATGTSSCATAAAAVASGSKADADGSKKDDKKKAAEFPCAASIIITTTHSFLNWNLTTLLNTGVDVPIAEDAAEAEANKDNGNDGEVRVKRVFPHIASIAVEEIGRATTAATPSSEKALQQWRDAHAAFYAAMTRQHPRYCGAAHLLPHVLWICRGPISRLPASLRQLLSRRSRRYYQLLPSTYIPSVTASLMPHPQEGLSTPAESLGIRLVLSQTTADKDAQLRRIVTDRSGLYHRVLILTHNKEVPQLNTLITSWGVSREYPSNSGNNNNNNTTGAAGQVMTEASPNLVHSTRRTDSVAAQHQCHTSYLNSCEAAEWATVPSSTATSSSCDDAQPASSPVVVTLIAWDAFTALDVMDVDVIVQYYPPQKSLTEQEWAEFIQLLHTTVDGEREIELSLRQNRNNKEDNIRAKLSQLMQATTTGLEQPPPVAATVAPAAGTASFSSSTSPAPSRSALTPHRPLPVLVTLMVAADFTLTAYFLHQYMYSGATGVLLPNATSTSLASITPVPGKPGVQEPLDHPIPVLDISPKHPYFIPLVCGHDGGADWPAGAAGSPPQARVNPPDATKGNNSNNNADAPLLTHFGNGKRVTVRNVLAAKLAMEQNRAESVNGGVAATAGKSPATISNVTSPTAVVGSTAPPVMLLAQGNLAMSGGGNSNNKGSSTADNGNLARLVAKNGMNTLSSSGSIHNNSNSVRGGAAGSVADATSSAMNAAVSSGNSNRSSANAQKSSNKNNNGSGNKGNANSLSTTSSSAAPAAAAASGNAGAAGQGVNKSPTPAVISPSSKNGNGGGSKRRQRSGKGNNSNSNNNAAGNNTGTNSSGNSTKKNTA